MFIASKCSILINKIPTYSQMQPFILFWCLWLCVYLKLMNNYLLINNTLLNLLVEKYNIEKYIYKVALIKFL